MHYLVTGGGGFVGKALVKKLRSIGHRVTSISRGDYPELRDLGADHISADLGADVGNYVEGFRGVDGVFHTAAKVDMWGRFQDFYLANVVATKNVIECCKQTGVRRLVFTSSPSVIAGGQDLVGVNEDYPYPRHFSAFYPKTKALAEQEVRGANDISGLRTVCLRPHLIWGPGDTNLVPTILERARRGRLVQVGNGRNLTDICFIDDCVAGHLLAMEALETKPKVVGGQVYFLSMGQPVPLWEFVRKVLTANRLKLPDRKLPAWLGLGIATVAEAICCRLPGRPEPILTKFLIEEMSTTHYFDLSRARRDLGFAPKLSLEEALAVTFSR